MKDCADEIEDGGWADRDAIACGQNGASTPVFINDAEKCSQRRIVVIVARAVHHPGASHVGRKRIGRGIAAINCPVELTVFGKITRLSCCLHADDAPLMQGVAFDDLVVVARPLRNRTAEANLGRSLAQGSFIQNQRAQFEQLIEADVRNATQALRSAEARLAAAASTRSSTEQQYESEQRQFRAGTTTVFLVLQRQNEVLAARGRELQAQTDLNKAIADFQRSTGNTLEANNVAVRSNTPMRDLNCVPCLRRMRKRRVSFRHLLKEEQAVLSQG